MSLKIKHLKPESIHYFAMLKYSHEATRPESRCTILFSIDLRNKTQDSDLVQEAKAKRKHREIERALLEYGDYSLFETGEDIRYIFKRHAGDDTEIVIQFR